MLSENCNGCSKNPLQLLYLATLHVYSSSVLALGPRSRVMAYFHICSKCFALKGSSASLDTAKILALKTVKCTCRKCNIFLGSSRLVRARINLCLVNHCKINKHVQQSISYEAFSNEQILTDSSRTSYYTVQELFLSHFTLHIGK